MKNRLKENTSEYTEFSLPVNRKTQFKDIVKRDYSLLIRIGLILLVFTIPLFATLIVASLFGQALISGGASSNVFITNDFVIAGCFLVSAICLAVGISGVDRIFRRICWDEPVIFKDDFKEGVKLNFKENVFICIIFSLILSATCIISDCFTIFNPKGPTGMIIFSVLSGVIVFFVLPLTMVSLAHNSYYTETLGHNLSNSIRMMFYRYLPLILFVIPFVLLFVLYLFTNIIFLSVYIVLMIFAGPIFYLGWHLYILSVFDFYINSQYKEIYKKGLYQGGYSNEEN